MPVTVLLLIGAFLGRATITDRLDTGGWIPTEAESVRVDQLLASTFDRRATSHLLLLEPRGAGATFTDISLRREAARIAQDVAQVDGVVQVYSPLSAPTAAMRDSLGADHDAWLFVVMVEEDLQTTIRHLPELKRNIASDLLDVRVSGVPALSAEFSDQVRGDLLKAEVGAFGIALLLLCFFAGGFRHALSIVLTTMTSVAALMIGIGLLSTVFTVNIFAMSIGIMVCIALSLDYGLLAALQPGSMVTGATVRTAALAVIAGMAGLMLLPIEAARSIGAVGVLGVSIVLVAHRVLLPHWFSLLGVRNGGSEESRRDDVPRWLQAVGRHPIIAFAAGVCLLAPLLVAATQMEISGPGVNLLPHDSEAAITLSEIESHFADIAVTPITIVAQSVDGSMMNASNLYALRQTETRLAALPGVASVRSVWQLVPAGISSPMLTASLALEPSLAEQARPLLTSSGAVIEVATTNASGPDLVRYIRDHAATITAGELRLQVGGVDASGVDLMQTLAKATFPAAIAVVAATLIVLATALRSVVLPLKAVMLNALPVLAGLGAVTLLFQLDTPIHEGTGATIVLVPVILIWLMYGISMDYEVFMLAHIRVHTQQGYDTTNATLLGIVGARRVVLRGAVLMGVVFTAFALSDVPVVRATGIGLLVAIVVDATIVRMLLLPASMILLGRWNWWWPTQRKRTLAERPASSHPIVIGDPP